MSRRFPAQTQSVREELVNTWTHGIGAAASTLGGVVLVTFATMVGGTKQILGAVAFSLALVLLYAASTLYHAVRDPVMRARLKVMDHCAIFLLIAGTYTPFTLISLEGPWGWSLFGVVWGLAATGILFKLFFTGRFRFASTVLYLGMGWLVVIAYRPLSDALSAPTVAWLVAGGFAYTVGTVFYLNRRIPYAHGIWHIFVLLGSACHFAAVLQVIRAV
jgi:hemolysin III